MDSFNRERLKHAAAALAASGVYIGTSSWKYEGWLGQLYDRARYEFRGRFARSRFERNCLAEYAEVFKTVLIDSAYYDFPTCEYLQRLSDAVPDDFRFGLKVTDALTVKRFPSVARSGDRAGQLNPDFLNADLFAGVYLKSCEAIRAKIGVIVFEFSQFWPRDYETVDEFLTDISAFLSKLPTDWPFGVELRNRDWLGPNYFNTLSRHGVAHVFNSWDRMPSVLEQMSMPGSRTNPRLVAARFLTKPGRSFAGSVELFQPYDKLRETYEDGRVAGASLMIESQRHEPRRNTYIYINNRLEGSALATIEAMIARLPGLLPAEIPRGAPGELPF